MLNTMKKSGGGREERKLRRKKTTKIHLSQESEAQVGLEGPTDMLCSWTSSPGSSPMSRP